MRRVQRSYDVDNNAEFAGLFARKGAAFDGKDRPITHDALKKWASGVQLMRWPHVRDLLRALHDRRAAEALYNAYCVARGLTFLIEAVGALSGTLMTFQAAQADIRDRYAEAYRRMCTLTSSSGHDDDFLTLP